MYEEAKTVSQTFFVFVKLFNYKNKNLSPHCLDDSADKQFFTLDNPQLLNVKNDAIGYVNTPKYFISDVWSLIVSESHSKFAIDVQVVVVSA